MTFAKLVGRHAEGEAVTAKEARRQVEAVVGVIAAELRATGRVHLPGFGVLTVVHRKARKGRHPLTGEALELPESTEVRFRRAKEFYLPPRAQEVPVEPYFAPPVAMESPETAQIRTNDSREVSGHG